MKRNLTRISSAICATIITLASTTIVNAAVYISYDSVQPSYEQNLANSQSEFNRELVRELQRKSEISEYYAAEIIGFQKEQQNRIDQRAQQLAAQEYINQQQYRQNQLETDRLIQSRASLEEQRVALVSDANKREIALLEESVQQEQNLLEKHNLRQEKFLIAQAAIQKDTHALQVDVKNSQDRLLEEQLRSGAPSNLIVASKDASNLKAIVDPTKSNQLNELGEAEQGNTVVNLNQFIASILPSYWHYSAPSGLDSETIHAVQGKNWQSILNLIAVNNPHLEIKIDPYKKVVSVKNTLQYAKTNPTNRTTPYATWHVRTDRTFRENIAYFAKQAKWDLIWEAGEIDYDTVAPAVIQARFASDDGVINKLVKLTEHKETPLFADWKFGNKVVIIKRKGATRK
ncbi:TcpQ domain-containing protein [Aliivibrio fischeri]|uniref:TcpQ domain-containing protein n=1 Tax=Aliivibrio fischeri TaxID=668 RepID=UPI0007C49D62|nr:TcpQ domain-containing protein [Aliivibrio fischeri]